jgi:hypothetical protein
LVIRRFGFRRILSLSALALYLALVVLGAATYQHGTQLQAQHRANAFQKGAPSRPVPTAAEPVEWRFATMLNIPGVACSTLFLALIAKHSSELYILLFSAPFVPFTWMLLGRSLDYQLRYLPRPPRTLLRTLLCAVAIAVAILLLLMLTVSIPKSGASEGQAWGTLYLFTWSAVLLTTSIASLIRRIP